MNRRRFLKYAGATAAIAGGSVLGLDYIARPRVPPVVSQTASGYSSSTAIPPITSVTTLPSTEMTQTSTTETGPTLVWESDFGDGTLDGYRQNAGIDLSVGCKDFQISQDDVANYIVKDSTAPAASGNALELVANKNRTGGLYVNAISFRELPFTDKARYVYYGYFRKTPNTKVQAITTSIELVRNYVEHYAEMLWTLNPFGQDYGMVVTRGPGCDLVVNKCEVIPLIKLGDDEEWHYWETHVRYDTKNEVYINEKMVIDNKEFFPNITLGTFGKWWENSFGVSFQVANQYTSCDATHNYYGAARLTKVGVKIESE